MSRLSPAAGSRREVAIVHAQQADRAERQQAHRHHPAEADAAGEQPARVSVRQLLGEVRAHHFRRAVAT
jgi:hypothetical protein